MQTKIMLLLTQRADQKPGAIEPHLASEGQRFMRYLSKGEMHRRAFRLADDPTRQTVYSNENDINPPAFDAIFEVMVFDANLEKLLSAIADIPIRLGNLLDTGKSAVIVGSEHVIIPGEEPLMLVFALRRLESLSSEAFQDYWLNEHASVALAVPGLQGYCQFHSDPGATIEAARKIGVGINDFDGAAHGFFRSIGDFLTLISQPEVTRVAFEDEKKFIDHSRSSIGLYQVVWNVTV